MMGLTRYTIAPDGGKLVMGQLILLQQKSNNKGPKTFGKLVSRGITVNDLSGVGSLCMTYAPFVYVFSPIFRPVASCVEHCRSITCRFRHLSKSLKSTREDLLPRAV